MRLSLPDMRKVITKSDAGAPQHIVKLCVGCDSLGELTVWQKQFLKEMKQAHQPAELMHITRHMPKRRLEVLEGGSLYWVIGGLICVRQRILDLRPVVRGGITHCAIVYDAKLVKVLPRPRRAFQGWRYLDAADVPPDLGSKGADFDPDWDKELWSN